MTPCGNNGHTMRTRSRTLYAMRYSTRLPFAFHQSGGGLYSNFRRRSFLKSGTSEESLNRVEVLNATGYAGVSDWKLISCFETEKAGTVEYEAQKKLESFPCHVPLLKMGEKSTVLKLLGVGIVEQDLPF